jgi:transglutaminase-like putative cysteine protease
VRPSRNYTTWPRIVYFEIARGANRYFGRTGVARSRRISWPTIEGAFLAPTPLRRFGCSRGPRLRHTVTAGASDPRERAVALYYAVRDGIRYDPYSVQAAPQAYRASSIVQAPAAFCVPKAILLAAAARDIGIPARLGFADVRNHLASEKLRARMGTDLFVFHGYTDLYLDGGWRKATPAFNRELCSRFGVPPSVRRHGRRDAPPSTARSGTWNTCATAEPCGLPPARCGCSPLAPYRLPSISYASHAGRSRRSDQHQQRCARFRNRPSWTASASRPQQ